jgi:hypothetical protein
VTPTPTQEATPEPTPAASSACAPAVASDDGVDLSIVHDLRRSDTEPGTLRLLGTVTNAGDDTVQVLLTYCESGVAAPATPLLGPLPPGETTPFVFTIPGDDPAIDYALVPTGFIVSPDELAATTPNLVLVSEEIHEPDADHPAMWLTIVVRNDGEVVAEEVWIFVTLYQRSGEVRDVIVKFARPVNPDTGEIGLAQGQASQISPVLDGIRSLSGDYDVRVVGVAPEGTAPATGYETPTPES